MNPRNWVPPVVFLATSLPTVLLLNQLDIANEFRLILAMGVGVAATAFAQSRLARQSRKEDEPGP